MGDDDVSLIRADNPGPFTLTGTNSWLVGREPAYLVDPGPALPDHLDALVRGAEERGGLGAIVLTHDHPDHAEAVAPLRRRLDAPLAAMRGPVDIPLHDGAVVGPLSALEAPGHAPDHVVLLWEARCFSGDAVLGMGSVFIAPGAGAMSGYLRALKRLQELDLKTIHPGHGPLVTDPAEKLAEYIAHRLERETRLLEALAGGLRSTAELLGRVWSEVPANLRGAAALTLEAHLEKLAEEQRLPAGVERLSLG